MREIKIYVLLHHKMLACIHRNQSRLIFILCFKQPPPPGYAANAAQMAASQGQSVNVQQRQAGWFSGGTGGGYTFW